MDIDPDIANWLLEFILRQSLEDQTLKSLLRALPLPNNNLNLAKSFLLKKLEFDNSVSVATLELLEQIEEIEFILGNETVSDTMKQAYCAVAVECTVKILTAEDGEDKDKRYNFFDEVARVWRGKIEKMKKNVDKGGLGSEALWAWKDEIEAAIWDYESIVNKSEGVNGVEAVNAYIREEREKMGPSFLELVAERTKSDAILQGIMGIHPAPGKEAPPPVVEVGSKETNKGKKLREKHFASRRTRGLASGNSRGAKIVDPNEMTNEPAHNKYKLPSSAQVHKAREALGLSSSDLQAVVTDPLPDALKLAQAITREARTNNPQDPAEDNHACADGVAEAPGGNTSNAPRPNLMERNNTAHAFEWDESIDGSLEDSACRGVARLPSPTRINTSPLNQYQIANLKTRRKARKWSLEEEETLRTEVSRYGKGLWKLILSLNRDTFEGRTEVDLKDKWRNMTRK